MNAPSSPSLVTRRRFLSQATGTLAGAAVLGALPVERFAHGASGSGPLKLAMVGCGGRGSGAASQALKSTENIKLVAVAELFRNKAEIAVKNLETQNPGKVDVPYDRIFVGFDGYKQAIAACDVVILATPCTFRPMMFEEAVKQGKHSFMEKPVALDAPGFRRVMASLEECKKKNLKVGVGLQRRHKPGYIEAVKRVQDGALGDQTYYRVYWNMGAARALKPRDPAWNELEYQLNNQFYFAWQCGDICLDMGLHNVDVINWIKGAYPISANSIAGAEVRRGKDAGCVYDHFAIEYEYADGTRLFAQNRQIPGCWSLTTECAHGTLGSIEMNNGKNTFVITGKNEWRRAAETPVVDAYQQEHTDLFDAIIKDQPYNEAERGALSTMSCIMGRMAGYSGQKIEWDEAIKSEKRLSPDINSLQDPPPVVPDENGAYPLPIPGKSDPV